MSTILIKNGILIDGSGKIGVKADILIQDGIIKEISNYICGIGVTEVLDATNLIVTPGFIDIHSHADATIFVDPMSEAKIRQGVTSEVSGNCGFTPFPVSSTKEKIELLKLFISSLHFILPKQGLCWNDFETFSGIAEKDGLGTNLFPLVGHGAIRIAVMGNEARKPTQGEMKEMVELLRVCLEQGVWGFSTGLAYAPGSFSEASEIEELCNEIKRYNSYYVSHIRDEGDGVLNSIDEIIEVGRKTGCRINISHLKAMGIDNWNKTDIIFKKINDAKDDGIDISADQYPYTASSTLLGVLIPKWANEGGNLKLVERLNSEETRTKILEETEVAMMKRGGPERILISACKTQYSPSINGKNIAEISKQFGLSPVETIAKLISDNINAVVAIYISMSEEDVEKILANKEVMVGSDGMYKADDPSHSHPRTFGTFPRVLGHYVRDKKLLSLEDAIRKMTSLPAERLGILDRGMLKEGFAADITIFNKDTVLDKADFVNANQKPDGILHVMVNGKWVLKDAEITGEKPGKIIKKK